MSNPSRLTRRDFLKLSVGTGISVAIYLSGCQAERLETPTAASLPTDTTSPEPTATPTAHIQPNAYLNIDTNGQVTITIPKPELGQGVRTALAMIITEELGAEWTSVRIEQAPASSEYGNQVVGGSRSVTGMYEPLRRAGALGRGLLIAAAAQTWGANRDDCYVEKGRVIHSPSGRKLTFGELVVTANEIGIAGLETDLKALQDFQIIGTSIGRWDESRIVNGSALFGSDIRLPDMLFAALARSPYVDGQVESYDDTTTRGMPGVRHVVEIESGVAVVAESTWQALKGREALEITWKQGRAFKQESQGLKKLASKHKDHFFEIEPRNNPHLAARQLTNIKTGSSIVGNRLNATYVIPHFAHATMEPMNCTADVRDGSCEVWAPTQDPMEAKTVASVTAGLGFQMEATKVNIPLIGGGFGRRLEQDYVEEAVQISKAIGAPVKLIWTREDDIQHDFFHSASSVSVSAPLDRTSMPNLVSIPTASPLRTGAWRSVQNFNEAFARECFLDEYAEALGKDPVELRMEVYSDQRLKAVLERAASEAGWGTGLPDGWGRGVACFSTWNVTPTAEIAEVSLAENGAIRVHRVMCVVDCGIVINPDIVRQQMEGGIAFALSAALKNEITVADGRVQQSNFHDYPILRMDEMPVVEVHILESDRPPQGIGEMGGPPLPPAVANALYAITGQRIRKLPIRLNGD